MNTINDNITIIDKKNIYLNLFKLLIDHKWELFKTLLLNKIDNIDINIKNNKNNYLLTYAVLFNKLDTVKLLLDNGATIDILDYQNRSLLFTPINFQYNDMLILLLEYNKKNIGQSIINIRDKYKKLPIHYCIEFNNLFALKTLIKFNSNTDVLTNDGYNLLQFAIYNRHIDIILYVINISNNINHRCITGESALHIAVNFQFYNICKLLLTKKIDINIQDYEHEYTGLHYAIASNNIQITKLLLDNNSNINIQDIYGRTPLHYAIIENNYLCLQELLTNKNSKLNINYNLWDIYSKLPLHIFFEKFNNNMKYVDIFIEKTNLLLKDINNNTCLYYIVKHNLWKKYYKILETKKLNIFLKNKHNKIILDYIDDKNMTDFITLVVKSYLYRLKNIKKTWIDKTDILCSKQFNNLSNKDKEKLKISNKTQFEDKCIKLITKKINNYIDLYKNGNLKPCIHKSYPIIQSKCYVLLNNNIDFCTFTGSTLDILIGLIFLLNKFKKICSTLNPNFSNNSNYIDFYESVGIAISNRSEFINFEIIWVNNTIHIMDNFEKMFKNCIKNKRFIIIPIAIEHNNNSHANYLLYDHKKKEIERFEPHGSTTPPGLNYNPSLLDSILKKKMKFFDNSIKYISPSEYLPKVGFQLIESNERNRKRIGDPGGFCALWSIWYIDMRITNIEIDRKKLVSHLIKKIKENNISFKEIIRNYSYNIIQFRDKLLKLSNLDINDWMNDQYTDEQYDKFILNINNEIQNIV